MVSIFLFTACNKVVYFQFLDISTVTYSIPFQMCLVWWIRVWIQLSKQINLFRSQICILCWYMTKVQGGIVVLWTEWHVICIIKMIKIHANYCWRMVHHQSNKLFWTKIHSISFTNSAYIECAPPTHSIPQIATWFVVSLEMQLTFHPNYLLTEYDVHIITIATLTMDTYASNI